MGSAGRGVERRSLRVPKQRSINKKTAGPKAVILKQVRTEE